MSLYLKYRPQKFEDLIGQDHVAKTLLRAVETGRVTHSYLFAGPRGTGKTTVARILARAVNCEAKKDQPCGKCLSCHTIEKGQSVDILEIDAASNRGIDEIRDLRDKVRFAPSYGKYKVYIIDEVHMLTKEAFNALLKTLEEPPAHAIFILATTEAHKVPATIVSRCQRFDFRRATLKSVLELLEKVTRLEKISAEVEALALVARAADGAYRDSLTLLEQMAEENVKINAQIVRDKLGLIAEPLMWQLIYQIIATDKKSAMQTFSKLSEQGIDWKFLTLGLMQKLRQLLFYKIAAEVVKSDLTDEEARQLQKLSAQTEEADVVDLINLFLRAEAELRYTSMPELPLGAAIIEFLNNRNTKKQDTSSKPSFAKATAGRQISNSKFQTPKKETKDQKKDVILSEAKNPRLDRQRVGQVDPSVESTLTQDDTNKSAESDRETDKSNGIDYSKLEPVDGEKWREVVSVIKKTNTTLAELLKQSHPYLQRNKLVIEVPYSFWEDRINSKKNAQAICAAACEVLRQAIECAIPRSNGALKKKLGEKEEKEKQKLKSDVEEVFG